MSETYPDDLDLLALSADELTGAEYIETGRAPYYLEFRKLLYRLLRHVAPLGLRAFKTGALAVQVKPGRYWLGGEVKSFAGSGEDVALTNNQTNYVYLDDANTVQAATAGWPGGEHVRLATIVTADGDFAHDDIADQRDANLFASLHGLTATVAELNKLDGAGANVTAANLDELTDGSDTDLHGHDNLVEDGQAGHTLALAGAGSEGVSTHLAAAGLDIVEGRTDTGDTYYHKTKYDADGIHDSLDAGSTYTTRRTAPVDFHFVYDGEIVATQSGKLMGLVPVDGTVEDVILSVQENGSDSADPLAVTATAAVNGTALCSADPAIDKTAAADAFATTAAAGSGITQATVKSDGTQNVSKGDILTVDLTLTRATPDTEITGVCVLVKIRPAAAD